MTNALVEDTSIDCDDIVSIVGRRSTPTARDYARRERERM